MGPNNASLDKQQTTAFRHPKPLKGKGKQASDSSHSNDSGLHQAGPSGSPPDLDPSPPGILASTTGAPVAGEEKKTRKQVQNRTAQRRYRGRQAEYVKQLETEIALLKADPEFRESAKDEWIKKLLEDNRQLKAFILGPHRITLTESIDLLLRKSYALENGVLQPFISSPVIEAGAVLADGPSAYDQSGQFNTTADNTLGFADDSLIGQQGSQHLMHAGNLLGTDTGGGGASTSQAQGTTAENNIHHNSTFSGMPTASHTRNQSFSIPDASAATQTAQAYPSQQVPSTRASTSDLHASTSSAAVASEPVIDQYSLRLPPSAAQPPNPISFAGFNHFLSSSAALGNGLGVGIPWQAHADNADQFARTGTSAATTSMAPSMLSHQLHASVFNPSSSTHNNTSHTDTNLDHSGHHYGGEVQTLNRQYPQLTGSSFSASLQHHGPTGSSQQTQQQPSRTGGLVGNSDNNSAEDASRASGSVHRVSTSTTGASQYTPPKPPEDGPPMAQKRRVGGYLGMNHDESTQSGLPGGQSGGDGGPSPIHVLPAQLYAQREQLSAMIRHVFEAPGQPNVDFSSADFSYEPFKHRLEPIFRFCWSWAMAIWPDEPEMEVAGMAWIIFLFSNAAVNFYLQLPEFLRPTREQQSLPHEAAVMFVPWKELRNQMVLLDGFVNFRIVGELVNCTCLQAGQYKPNAGPIGAPKPASEYGAMRHIKELTYFDESFIPFDHLIDIDNWRLSRDAISRFPQVEIPERLIESGDVRKRKEQAWAEKKSAHASLPT
ncbi:hypothetical protein OC846_000271 [Tilletia horrida]|uniref:BZIP domain-containing protein n=1 Tax=Tilletia horrida TaxID=155126 RepID=A0AAN6H134_9BASI|nr:hypothetical protein OC846_000271 [Tilletia horrida]KAK0570322.1 hypothetical protein OC861_000065 [Tilletia horrida]